MRHLQRGSDGAFLMVLFGRRGRLTSRRRQQSPLRPPWPRNAWRRATGFALFRRSPFLRNAGVVFAILALVVQAWLPSGYHHATALVAKTAASADFFRDGFALCSTKDGDGRGRSGSPDKAPPWKPSPCPICQAAQSIVTLAPPASTLSLEGVRLVILRLAPSQELVAARPIHAIPQPRAPPVTA